MSLDPAYYSEAETIGILAPAAGTTVDVPILVGGIFGLPLATAASGVAVALKTMGIIIADKSGVAMAVGDRLFWNAGANNFTLTPTDIDVGAICVEAAGGGAAHVKAVIGVHGRSLAAGILQPAIAASGAAVVLAEPTGGGANTVTMRAPALTGNRTVTFPDADVNLALATAALAASAAMNTVATAGASASITLAEATGGGPNTNTVTTAALTGDRTFTLPDVDVVVATAILAPIAALGAANTDVSIEVDFCNGVAQAGTWTPTVSATGIKSLTRTAAAAAQSYWITVPLRKRGGALKGFAPKGLVANYSVNAALLDDVRFEVWVVTLGADGAGPTGVVLFGDLDAQYDAAHNTAAERGDNTGAPELHRAEITFAAGTYIGAEEQLMIRVLVDGDAGPAGVFVLNALQLIGEETLVDLT